MTRIQCFELYIFQKAESEIEDIDGSADMLDMRGELKLNMRLV